MKRVRISVDVDKDVQKAFKNLCNDNDIAMTNALEEAIKKILANEMELPIPKDHKKREKGKT